MSFYLQTIETDIRTYITYIVSNHYKADPLWFVNPSYVGKEFVDEFTAGYSLLKRNEVIKKHHRKHPEDICSGMEIVRVSNLRQGTALI